MQVKLYYSGNNNYTVDLPDSVLCRVPQTRRLGYARRYGDDRWFAFTISYGDACKNGYNTFSITGEEQEREGRRWIACGCLHEDFAGIFPDVARLLRWNLVSTNGPLHYLSNAIYHAEQGNLAYARSSAVWPEAELEDFTAEKLLARLPALMEEFRAAIEWLGFVY